MTDKHEFEQMEYSAPTVRSLGTVKDLTEASNKIGSSTDRFTSSTGGTLVGSVVPGP